MTSTPTILIVEDDLGIAELERGRLEEAGYRIAIAATAEDAMRKIQDGAVDLIVLDYRLTGETDGLDLYARMKAAGHNLPVILVTGFSDEAIAIRALQAGVRDFVAKSVEYLDYLPDMVERILRQTRTERRLAESEARLAGIIESAKDAIIVVESNRKISLFNPAAERMFGCPASAALGRWLTDFIPEEQEPVAGTSDMDVGSLSARLREGTQGVRADGEGFPLEATVSVGGTSGRRFATVVIRDITARKQAEADLRRTTELLKAVVEGTTDAVYVKNRDGKYLLYNEAAARLIGKSVAEVLGEDDTALFDPESARRVMERDRLVMATGTIETEEETLTAAGITRTYHAIKGPYRDEKGSIAGVLGISRDITDRKRAEETLARDAQILASVRDSIIVTDLNGIVTYWNAGATRLFGWTAEEMIGRHYTDRFPEPTRTWIADEISRRATGEDWVGEFEDWRKDGSRVWIDARVSRIVDVAGRPVGILGVSHDITDRKRAEEDLRLRDRAIRAVAQGIMITDPNQRDNPVIYSSPGFQRLTGYTAEEVVGHNCRFLQGKDTDPAAVAQVRVAIHAGEPCTVELLNYRKDGTSFWNELSISPVRDETGRLTHFVGVQTDVSGRRSLEDQFRQAQKMDAIGRLAGGVAHDFNNLLTVINGYSEVLLGNLPTGDPTRDLIQEIHGAGERASGLTRQLLAFSRKAILEPRVLDLGGVVANVERMLRRILGEDIQLAFETDRDVGMVNVDPSQIEQVILNLVVNARDAMPQGGRLTIEIRNAELDATYAHLHLDARPGRHVLLAVTDTGCGMDAATIARIFEPFFTTKGEHGTGLGLATVHGIVKQSGGHVAVYSEVGHGTTFKVYLPRVESQPPVSPARSNQSALPRGSETVLLVEDEDAVRELTRRVCQGCGYTVLEARDGAEAIRLAETHPGRIDLLISDVVLPGIAGREVAERLAGMYSGIKILFMSGYTDDAVVRHGILEAKVAFLQKPFTPVALARKVREVLDSP
jgi:PAS domain S-box-containing protein